MPHPQRRPLDRCVGASELLRRIAADRLGEPRRDRVSDLARDAVSVCSSGNTKSSGKDCSRAASRGVIGRSSVGCRKRPFSGRKNSVRIVTAGRCQTSRPRTSLNPASPLQQSRTRSGGQIAAGASFADRADPLSLRVGLVRSYASYGRLGIVGRSENASATVRCRSVVPAPWVGSGQGGTRPQRVAEQERAQPLSAARRSRRHRPAPSDEVAALAERGGRAPSPSRFRGTPARSRPAQPSDPSLSRNEDLRVEDVPLIAVSTSVEGREALTGRASGQHVDRGVEGHLADVGTYHSGLWEVRPKRLRTVPVARRSRRLRPSPRLSQAPTRSRPHPRTGPGT